MTRVVEGAVAPLGVQSVDGRRIKNGSLSAFLAGGQVLVNLDDGPVEVSMPLMGLRKAAMDHLGAEVVGRLTRVWIGQDDWVHVEGEVQDSVKPGEYGCGVDLLDLTSQLVDAAGDPVDMERMFGDQEGPDGGAYVSEVIEEVQSARLLALTIYLDGSTAKPAFEGAEVTVR